MQKYVQSVIKEERIFDIILNGFFLDEDAMNFVTDYSANIKKFDPAEYSMIIDCVKLSTIKADLIPSLEQCYRLYMSSGFKRIIFICPPSSIGKSQLKRVGTNVNIVADFVDSREEAVKLAKA